MSSMAVLATTEQRAQGQAPPSPQAGRRRRVLVTLGGGGFGHQSLRLIDLLGPGYEYHCVVIRGLWGDVAHTVDENWKLWELTSPGIIGRSFIARLANGFRCFWEARQIVRRARPDAMVCLGTSLSVPLCFWGRVLGVRSIYIECVARGEDLSLTGRIIHYGRLTDRFFVQWPELVLSSRMEYFGRLM